MELLYVILVLLTVTRLFGEVAERLKQPALVGELVSGLALGVIAHHFSSTLPVLANLSTDKVFIAVTDLSIFFLMLLAGIELHPREIAGAAKSAAAVALGGMLLPLIAGVLLGWWFLPVSEYRLPQALFVATALSITAVPVSVRVLMDLDKLKSPLGKTIVSAAVFDDIASLVLLAVLTAVIKTGGFPKGETFFWLFGKLILFFIITTLVGRYLYPYIGKIIKKFYAQEFEFSGLLIAALAYSMLAETLGIHFILGAFLGGLFFVRRTIAPKVYTNVREKLITCTSGLFAPLFFASIGMHLDISAATQIPVFTVLLVIVAFLGKLIGSGLPAYWSGFSARDSVAIGTGMSARGAVELIIADIALRAGLFNQPQPVPEIVRHLFSAVVIVAIVTTIITPIVLKTILKTSDGK